MIEQAKKFNYLRISAEFVGKTQIDPVARKKVLHGELDSFSQPRKCHPK